MPLSTPECGELHYRVTLTKPTETTGDAALTYVAKTAVWADKRELGGADRAGIVAEAAVLWIINYRTDVSPRWCVEWANRRWQIDSVSDPDGRRLRLNLVCTELKEGGGPIPPGGG